MGLGGPYIPYNAWINLDNAGGDFMYEKPPDYSTVGSGRRRRRKRQLRRSKLRHLR